MLRKLVAVAMAAALMAGASGSYAHGQDVIYDLSEPLGGSSALESGNPSEPVPSSPADLTVAVNNLSVGASINLTE
ncbi:MAG: hypothetical protein LIQ30_01505 [Planctomycetes bacterium]|nr:hypothetical protein [Planctomycetota bacterium]MCC8116498.1 hypothetical protein [Planctomycetota bacterium]